MTASNSSSTDIGSRGLSELSLALARLTRAEFLSGLSRVSRAERAIALRLRFRHRLDEFARYCFPAICTRPFNRFHLDLLDREKRCWTDRAGRTQRRACSAPRGIAKSTLTRIDVAHDLVYGLEAFIVILSATRADAWSWTRNLRELLTGEGGPAGPLQSLYGAPEIEGSREIFWIRFPGRPGVPVVSRAFGRGTVRGLNESGRRPTRVIIDDGEDRRHVDNPVIREVWQDFLSSDVLKLAAIEGGALYDWLGTILHPDSILQRLLKGAPPNAGWTGARYQALQSWPQREDLWEQCRGIWADLDLSPDPSVREARARAYYDLHRAEMDAGAEVLDPVGLPLFRVYATIWAEGLASALKELQGEPSDPSARIFDLARLRRCAWSPKDGRITTSAGQVLNVRDCRVGVWLDPIPAERTGSDYAALAVVARDPRTTRRFVLECRLERIGAALQRRWIWEALERYGPLARYGYEHNGFAALFGEGFEREAGDRRKAGLPADLRLKGHASTENKIRRIARLAPDLENGWIELANSISEQVLDQLRDLPGGIHDDGPDAIERADWLIGRRAEITTAETW